MTTEDNFKKIRWFLLALIFLFMVLDTTVKNELSESISVAGAFCLVMFVLLHGKRLVGIKSTIFILFTISVVSYTYEKIGMITGLPYGQYRYNFGHMLFEVPVEVLVAYSTVGYTSYVLGRIILSRYRLESKRDLLTVPLAGTFIMLSWDLCMDPLASTVAGLWVWETGGAYFGVPITNFFGWALNTFTFYFIVTAYFFRKGRISFLSVERSFLFEVVFMYLIVAFRHILPALLLSNGFQEVYQSVAILSVIVMGSFIFLASVRLIEDLENHYKIVKS
jgi:putative membrane protein